MGSAVVVVRNIANCCYARFLRWRVALMELGIEKLGLTSATKPIPDFGQGPDPYQGIQVHDYMSVSFLRQDPYVKAASKKTIEVFSIAGIEGTFTLPAIEDRGPGAMNTVKLINFPVDHADHSTSRGAGSRHHGQPHRRPLR